MQLNTLRKPLFSRKTEGGFTLIELLIVIVILAVLAAIVVFAVGGASNNASVAACKSDAKSLETALESYKANFGTYPPAVTAANDANWTAKTVNSTSTLLGLLTSTTATAGTVVNTTGPFLRAVPDNYKHYVVWYDASGSVWVAKSAPSDNSAYPATANGSNFDATSSACDNVAT